MPGSFEFVIASRQSISKSIIITIFDFTEMLIFRISDYFSELLPEYSAFLYSPELKLNSPGPIWKRKYLILSPEAVVQRCLVKKVFEKILQNLRENTCTWVSFLIELKKTLAQLFSCEFCELFKSSCLEEHLQTTASVVYLLILNLFLANVPIFFPLNTVENLWCLKIF